MTLSALGYERLGGVWEHPEGRVAAFLGDFIDAGGDNRKVIEQVRAMVQHGTAIAVMGNHELNALHYHTSGKNWLGREDGFMRAHDEKNTAQHQSFLDEYPVGSDDASDVMAWFMELPVFIEFEGLRLVHACWNAADVEVVRERRPDGRLDAKDLQEIALENTSFGESVVNLLKGPEAELPQGYSFRDYKGHRRAHVRIKWWANPDQASWQNLALSVPNTSELPETALKNPKLALYPPDERPVFFGHYKFSGRPTAPDGHNVMCLDYPESICAYRWAGEAQLSHNGVVVVS